MRGRGDVDNNDSVEAPQTLQILESKPSWKNEHLGFGDFKKLDDIRRD